MENLTKEIILEKIHENRKIIRNFGVSKLTLFGSYAKGEQTKNSDIDFLVEFEKGRGLFKDYMNLSIFLEELFNKEVDLVKPHLVRDELKSEILEGINIGTEI